jgi:8-oxo-dGTP pyrophosphatase MutT (NUDIX family)
MSRKAASGMTGPAAPVASNDGAASPAADRAAPYARLAVVGLICRTGDEAGGQASGGRKVTAGVTRWLLLHRVQPFDAWDPPGGRMEVGEDLVQAVRREVAEETGLAVEVGGPCYAFLTFYKGERLLAISMACRPAGDPDHVRLEPAGAVGWKWATGEEWEGLAAAGLSSWDPVNVGRATAMATALWEADQR